MAWGNHEPLPLMFSVLQAVITLGLTGIPGFLAGIHGSLDQEFLQKFAWFKITFFAPSLIISSVGARFTFERLTRVLPLVFWSCCQLATGFMVSQLVTRLCSSTAWARQRSLALAQLLQVAIMFQNIGAYNIPLLRSICSTAGLFPEHSEHCFDDGVLMIFGYHVPFDLAVWTFGYGTIQALKEAEKDSDAENAEGDLHNIVPEAKRLGARFDASALIKVARDCLNPVVIAMFLGMIIGLTPILRTMLFSRQGVLRMVGDSLKRLGEVVPVISLQILTATLGGATRKFVEAWRAQQKVHDETALPDTVANGHLSDGSNLASYGWWMVTVLLGKLVILPALGFVIFACLGGLQHSVQHPPVVLDHGKVSALSTGTGIPGENSASTDFTSAFGEFLWPNDKLFRAVVVMQWSAPSCMTLIVLCHKVGLDQKTVQAVAALYLIMYALAATATTFWVTIGLAIF